MADVAGGFTPEAATLAGPATADATDGGFGAAIRPGELIELDGIFGAEGADTVVAEDMVAPCANLATC